MNRIMRAAAMVALVGSVMAGTTLSGHAADVNAIKSAGDQLVALGKNAYQTGQAPRATDPKVAALRNTVLDIHDLALSPPLPLNQLAALTQWEGELASVDAIYELAGTGYADFTQVTKATDQAKLLSQVAQNVVTYAPELGQIYDSELVVTSAWIQCFGTDLWDHPTNYQDAQSRQGIREIRAGAVIQVSAVLTNMTLSGLSDDWRRARVVALIAVTPYIAKFLLPEQRKLLHDDALQAAQKLTDPVLQAGLKGLADMFIS